ncbi:MAG: hypothetical protein ACR2GP_04485 [Burkholderiaceae bacterium]
MYQSFIAPSCPELERFESGAFDPAQFRHCDHVRVAFEMLGHYPFAEAASRFSRGLRAMTLRAGKPEAYHETITIAFLSLIAEARDSSPSDFEVFAQHNPDLFDKRALLEVYSQARLESPIARRTFVLPR